MKTADFIKMSLDSSKDWVTGLLSDMEDAPLVQPTSNGGNHPLWILGHLVCSESALLDQFIEGKPNRFPALGELFSNGTTPAPDADKYPPMEELFAKFDAIRADTLAYLETLSDDDLDKPSHAPTEFGAEFATIAGCFAAMIAHVMNHAGQVADARRAAGREPMSA